MPTQNEIDRLAAMANALRPDWPVVSLRSHIAANHNARSYRDLAVALAWIGTDPATDTPARIGENGPWWAATAAHSVKAGERQRCPEHKIPLAAGTCNRCADRASEYVPGRARQLWRDTEHAARQSQEDNQ